MPTRQIDQKELDKFATQQIYWWGGERTGVELDHILVTILAKKPKLEKEIREKFALTDEDFRHALENAAPGVFWGVAAEERWEAANRRFGIDPPLPFPVIDWGARLAKTENRKFL